MYTVETTKELDNMQFRFTGFKNHAFLSVSILLFIFTGALDTSKKKNTLLIYLNLVHVPVLI